MTRKWKPFIIAALSLAASQAALGQATILEIDMDNIVFYFNDDPDIAKFAVNPSITALRAPNNFKSQIWVSDVMAVNGKPAKGTWVGRATNVMLRTSPTAGQAIADVVRQNIVDTYWEILQPDGAPIGTITTSGMSMGSAPPGAPLVATGENHAITGGTGAFLGSRGQALAIGFLRSGRSGSMTEDPGNRRINGGGAVRFVLHVIPMSRPEVMATPNGPAVYHADFALVTASRPVRAGEVVILNATGLGPTRPGVNPGAPFTADPLQEVNSPVEVTVNGKPAEVINKIGFPGAQNLYRIDFRVPEGTAAGMATLRLSAAWIEGAEVRIAAQ